MVGVAKKKSKGRAKPGANASKATRPPKRRTPVPQTVADEVMVECDRTCCVCRRHEAVQIHHLNEVPDDHRFENLAPLCFDCHDATQITGGFGRRLRGGEVRIARDQWYATVRQRREAGLPRIELSDSIDFSTVMQAVAVVRIREIGLQAGRGGELDSLYTFIAGFGPRVALEALDALSLAAPDGRETADRAERICDLVRAFLPIYSLVGRRTRPLTTEEREVLHAAQEIGREVAHHAARRSKNLVVLNTGARVLWSILRFAVLNDEAALRSSTSAIFDELKGWCEGSHFCDGHRWLTFLTEDATQPVEFTGVFPADIAAKLSAR